MLKEVDESKKIKRKHPYTTNKQTKPYTSDFVL